MINANNIENGVNGVENGADSTRNGTNGVEVPLNKEHAQVEKLLQIIEKKPFATQAYYAEKIGVSKRTISRFFAGKGCIGTEWNKEKSKLDNSKTFIVRYM